MSSNGSAADDYPASRIPWVFLALGLGISAAVVFFLIIAGATEPFGGATNRFVPSVPEVRGPAPEVQALLVLVALVSAGFAVSLRPRSALMLLGAAATAHLGRLGLDPSWDSARMVVGILAVLALAGSVIVLLPMVGRRAVVSALIVFHFGAIAVAVMRSLPQNTPWLADQLHMRVYHPYQTSLYLVNAYHYYAPDPGDPYLLWFCIEYEDHSRRWVKVPDRKADAKDPLSLEFYRRLPLGDHIQQSTSVGILPDDTRNARQFGGQMKGIPLSPSVAAALQYRPLSPRGARQLVSFVRFVAREFPNELDPNLPVIGIKVYGVIHSMLTPGDVANKRDPLDKTLFQPFFLGEFDAQGNLKDRNDPFLYWHIPICMGQKPERLDEVPLAEKAGQFRAAAIELVDCLKVHAGSDPWGDE